MIASRLTLKGAAQLSSVNSAFRQPDGVLRPALLALDQLPAAEFAGESGTLMKPFAEMLDRPATTGQKLHGAAIQLYLAAEGLSSPVRAEVVALIASRIDRMPPAEHVDVLDCLTAGTLPGLGKADMQVLLQALALQLKLCPSERRFDMVTLFACQNEFGHMGPSKDACLDPPQRAQVPVTLAGEMHWAGNAIRFCPPFGTLPKHAWPKRGLTALHS